MENTTAKQKIPKKIKKIQMPLNRKMKNNKTNKTKNKNRKKVCSICSRSLTQISEQDFQVIPEEME